MFSASYKSCLFTCISILFVSLLAGCSTSSPLAHKDEDTFARKFLEVLRTQQVSDAEKLVAADQLNPKTISLLTKMKEFLSVGVPTATEMVGFNTFESFSSKEGQLRRTQLNYQIAMPHSWVFASLVVQDKDHHESILSVSMNPSTESLAALHSFYRPGKPFTNYLILALTLASQITVLTALFFTIRMKKWKWIIAPLVQLTILKLNWTTGEVVGVCGVMLSINLGFGQPYCGPLIIDLMIPVGAIVFSLRQKPFKGSKIESKAITDLSTEPIPVDSTESESNT